MILQGKKIDCNTGSRSSCFRPLQSKNGRQTAQRLHFSIKRIKVSQFIFLMSILLLIIVVVVIIVLIGLFTSPPGIIIIIPWLC